MTKWVVSEDAAAPAALAAVAQLVERVLGKDEVMGSNPISSSAVLGFIMVEENVPFLRIERYNLMRFVVATE